MRDAGRRMGKGRVLQSFVNWNRDQALPFWAERGFNWSAGRFAERLDAAARPLAVPHRAMVQARQVYVFAHAARLGWFPEGATLAETAMASLRRDFLEGGDGRAGLAFSVDPASGRIVSATRDSYTHAFALFALAHLYALTGDPALPPLAEGLTGYVEAALVDPAHGGVLDAPGSTAMLRQNPQMHLLEAYLALEESMPGRGYRERADALIALFRGRMARADSGTLPEYFAPGWARHPDPKRADLFEPGHHYEWVWLLNRHGALSGADHADWQEALHRTARTGGHAANGLIHDELCAVRGVTKPAHRLWPHTEAIKAGIARHRRGDPHALPFAAAMAGLLAAHFLDTPFAGGWCDQITPAGTPVVDYVPASSLYHLFLAATEAAGVKADQA